MVNKFPLVAVAILNIFLAMVIVARNKRNFSHVCLAIINLGIVLWSISVFMSWSSAKPSASFFWAKMSFIGPIFIPIALLLFSYDFAYGERPKHWYLIPLLAIPFYSMLFNNMIISGATIESWGPKIHLGRYYQSFPAYFLALIALAYILLFRTYREAKSVRRAQMHYVFLGTFLSAIAGIVLNVILPSFGIDNLTSLGPLATVFLVGFTTYAIAKHRLMDIRLMVARSVAYSLLVAVIGGFFVFTVVYSKRFYESFISPELALITTGFIAAFGFQPLHRLVRKYTDRIFAKERYNFEELLSHLGEIFSSNVVLEDLSRLTMEALVKELRITRAAFILSSDHQIYDIKSLGYEKVIPTRPAWERAAAMALKQKKLTVADELEEGSEERELMRELGVEVLVPLPTEDKFVGLLALGEKRSGDMYTTQDLKLLEIIAPEAAIAVQNALLFKEKEKRIQELDSLYNLALSLGSTLHLNELLEQVIDEAIAVTGAETGSIMLIDEESQTLSIKVSRGIHPEIYRSTRIKIGEGIAGWVAQTSQPLVLIDGQDPRFQEHLKRDEIISALTVPLKVRERVIGVLSVNRKDKKEIFTQDNLRIITSFAAQAAEAIENARLYENLQQTFLGTISALAAAVDAKDHYTYGHSEMVTDLSVATARELMLPAEEVRKIEIASKLHDIGKIGIDGAILNKPGRLTEEERRIIEEHPKIAVDILKSVEPLQDIIPLILYHHERFDGGGYPVGLSGNAIPLGARILATADSFNAMVSDRPYRPALDLFTATRELQDNSGTQFDPQVVEAFLRVLERKYVRDSKMLVT